MTDAILQTVDARHPDLDAMPHATTVASLYYLTEGRNVWHSQKQRTYFPSSFSNSLQFLKDKSERLRKQGSEFYIERHPTLLLTCGKSVLGITPSVAHTNAEYSYAQFEIAQNKNISPLRLIVSQFSRMFLVFDFSGLQSVESGYQPMVLISSSSGSRYLLNWIERANPPDFASFRKFCDAIRAPKPEITPHSDVR